MTRDGDTRRLPRRYPLFFASLLAFLVFAVTAAGNLGASTFDAGDGNPDVNGQETDWETNGLINCQSTPTVGCALDRPTGQTDDSFGQGADENEPNPAVVDGSIPNNKSDLTRFYVANERVGTDEFLYLAWERVQEPTGTTNMDFEFNKNKCVLTGTPPAPTADSLCSTNGITPARSAGDLLVMYDLSNGGVNPSISFSRWVTSGTPSQVCEAGNKLPCWGKRTPIANTGGQVNNVEGSINTATVTDDIAPGAPRPLDPRTFGEAAINLTGAGIFSQATCEGFGSAYLKSRSSDAFTSALKDFIAPIPVTIFNCGKIELRKALVPTSDPGRFDLFIKKGAGGTAGSVDSESNVGDGGTTGENQVLAGTYNVSETAAAGSGTNASDYTTSLACFDDDDGDGVKDGGEAPVGANGAGDVSVGIGDDVVCTFTNTRKTGKIEVVKDFDANSPASARANLFVKQGTTTVASRTDAADGDGTGEVTVPTGSYDISETQGSNTSFADYTTTVACVDEANGNASVTISGLASDNRSGTVSVAHNADVKCTFTNARKVGKIELVKDFDANSPSSARADLSIKQGGNLISGGFKDDAADGQGTGELTVPTGSYDISEAAGLGTDLADYNTTVQCVREETNPDTVLSLSGIATDNRAATVAVGDGHDVKCTFTNARKVGKIQLVKDFVGAPSSARADLFIKQGGTTISGGFANDVADGGGTAELTVPTGSYDISELAGHLNGTETDLADYVTSVTCVREETDPDTALTLSNVSTNNRSATVAVGDGQDVKCTFTNTRRTFTIVAFVCETTSGSPVLYASQVTLPAPGTAIKTATSAPGSATASDVCGMAANFPGKNTGNYAATVNIGVSPAP